MVVFSVPNMECGGCAKPVTAALRRAESTAQSQMDLSARAALRKRAA